ncbi:MAG: hypothetical protein GY696_15800 [Gammaproteobacteria bacterium]|nr:hypothetical protein [Gammaproteobacteria bacterium]
MFFVSHGHGQREPAHGHSREPHSLFNSQDETGAIQFTSERKVRFRFRDVLCYDCDLTKVQPKEARISPVGTEKPHKHRSALTRRDSPLLTQRQPLSAPRHPLSTPRRTLLRRRQGGVAAAAGEYRRR